jgi:hypothetical protein
MNSALSWIILIYSERFEANISLLLSMLLQAASSNGVNMLSINAFSCTHLIGFS